MCGVLQMMFLITYTCSFIGQSGEKNRFFKLNIVNVLIICYLDFFPDVFVNVSTLCVPFGHV